MSAEAPVLTLRQRAVEAARSRRSQWEHDRAANVERLHADCRANLERALSRIFLVDVKASWDEVGKRAVAVVDGLLFELLSADHFPYYPAVMVPCQRCSTPLPHHVSSLEGLGTMLDGTAEKTKHYGCPAEPPPPAPATHAPDPPSTAEQLLALLEEFIRERVPVVQS